MARTKDPMYIPPKLWVSQVAQERLSQDKEVGTSDLSAAELMLVHAAGFEPLKFVMGAACFHIPSFDYSGYTDSFEVKELSEAVYGMRDAAFTRMEAEANALGADGVVGVRFGMTWVEHYCELYAYGTAVKAGPKMQANRPEGWRNKLGMPFTSDLSGQDFYLCLMTGYAPVGFVMGSCVYHMGYRNLRTTWKQRWSVCEIDIYTQAEYDAREIAMERMEALTHDLGGTQVVDFNLTHQQWTWGHTIEFLAAGTAVTRFENDPVLDPTVVLNLMKS